MSNVLRRNRKGSDQDITRWNSIGLSLATIAEKIGCHPTSVTLRLKSLRIPAADTRRAFMEDIYNGLPTEFQEDVADILAETGGEKPVSIKDYVRTLLVKDVTDRKNVFVIFPDESDNDNFEMPLMSEDAASNG